MSDLDLAELHVTRTPDETRIVAALLRAEGIPAFIGGEQLADEFAVSQRWLNLQGVTIHVPRSRLADARAAIAAARAAGGELAASTAESEVGDRVPAAPPARSSGAMRFLVIAEAIVILVLGILWVTAEAHAARRYGSLYKGAADGFAMWRDTDRPAYRVEDKDGNGIDEVITFFDRAGLRSTVSYDRNQNGIPERTEVYDSKGKLVYEIEDKDEDGRPDVTIEHGPGDITSRWTDTDGDRIPERREVMSPEGKVLFVEVNRGREGFVRVEK